MKRKIKVKRKKKEPKVKNLHFPVEPYIKQLFGISQSLFTSYQLCDRILLFMLNRWTRPGKEENFFYGNVVHEVLDRCYSYYETAPGEEEIEEEMNDYLDEQQNSGELGWITTAKLEHYKLLVVVVLTKYFEFYEDDFDFEFEEVEGQFDVQWKGFRLIGKCDGKFRKKVKGKNKRFLFEHKTKTQISEDNIVLKLLLDFQNKYYMLADFVRCGSWVDAVLYNIIRRPQLKKGGNESSSAFADRLSKDIDSRPDFYFKRFEAEYSKEIMNDFQVQLFEKLTIMDKLIKGSRMLLLNESNCLSAYPCDYLEACSTGSLKNYKQQKYISPELEF